MGVIVAVTEEGLTVRLKMKYARAGEGSGMSQHDTLLADRVSSC